MKKLFTIFAALFALALIGCEDSSEQLFTEIEEQNIQIFDDNAIQTEVRDIEIEIE